MLNTIKESSCDCSICSNMCTAPCCGTPRDIMNLIKEGYSNSLMFDDLPGGPNLLKPALKGYESKRSPWETHTDQGCTFWKDGKCTLHDNGLKPIQGKLVSHDSTDDQYIIIGNMISESWETEEAKEVINFWKKQVNWEDLI